jgi:hypothetical protein
LHYTVGVSLLTNTGSRPAALRPRNCKALNEACQQVAPADTTPNTNHRSNLYEKLKPYLGKYTEELSYRSHKDYSDRLPQELSYLFSLRDQMCQEGTERPLAEVLLLASDTYQGRICAAVISDAIAEYLQEFKLADDTIANDEVIGAVKGAIVVKGLEGRCEAFQEEVLPALLRAISRNGTSGPNDRIVLNPTGGFKGLIPYSTLALHALPSRTVRMDYLFEDAQTSAHLPTYPVGLDFQRWHREHVLMEAYAAAGPSAAWKDKYYAALDRRMQECAKEKRRAREKGLQPHETLAGLYETQYLEMRSRDPLQVFSERTVNQFLDDASLTDWSRLWKQALMALVPTAGALLWQGDKLPMAANHSSDHHHDLLQILQMLLTPIADTDIISRKNEPQEDHGKCFLNNAERIVLFAGVMLHDCGHTLDRLPHPNGGPEIVLFRSEIRKLHHYLAWYRLTQGMLNDLLGWEPPEENGVWEAIRLLCFHHRKSTGWDETDGIAVPYSETTFQRPCHVRLTPLPQAIDYPKLVALMRLIDGCDNQMVRVGGQWQAIEKQLVYDRDTWLLRAKEALAVTSGDGLENNAFVNAIKDWITSPNECPPTIPWVERRTMEEKARKRKEGAQKYRLWLELARTWDEFTLRDGQYIHFLRHALVDELEIMPSADFDEGSKWSFDIRFRVGSQELWDKAHTQKYKGDLVSAWVEKDVKSEVGTDQLAYLAEASGRTFELNFAWRLPDSTASRWL